METTTRNILYTELSCTNCIYGQLERTPAYWENPEEWNIECNYPAAGNISPNQDSIDESFHHDYIDDAIECKEYKLASKK